MSKKQILAGILSLLMIACVMTGCEKKPAKTPPDNSDATKEAAESIIIDENNVDVTGITGVTDKDGKVIDDKGIVDAEGHKIYSTGQKTEKGETIYTTGKKDANGQILYTLNKTDDRGRLRYYTATEKDGKLELKETDAVPDYTTDKNSTLNKDSRYTTTTTVKMGKETISPAKGISKNFTSYSGSKGQDQFKKVVSSANGGYIVTGISSSNTGIYENASSDWQNFAHITKYNSSGDAEWTYVTGGDQKVDLFDVAELKDGSIVAVGSTAATNTDAPLNSKYLSSLIVKLDKDGGYMWSYSFPGDEDSDGDEAQSVAATSDGGFVVGGYASSTSGFFKSSEYPNKAYIIKCDQDGVVLWRKILSGSKNNNIKALCVNDDGDIFASCVTHSSDGSFSAIKGYGSLSNTVILKLDDSGSVIWTSNLIGSGESDYSALAPTPDGGVIAGGRMSINKRADGSYSMCYGLIDGYVVRFSKDGQVYWARNVGGSKADDITGVAYTDQGIVISGISESSDADFTEYANYGGDDGFIMILNDSGQTVYTEKFEGKLNDKIFGLAPTDNGFAVVGFTESSDGTFAQSNSGKVAEGYIVSCEFKK